MRPIKILLSVLITATTIQVGAQSGKLFTVESGLSSSMVTDIHQCRNGFVWIATEDGLNRFDGSKNTLYRADRNTPGTILNDMVIVMGSDSQDMMYVGYLNGLQYYNDFSNTFHNVPLRTAHGQLCEPHVTAILQRKNGQLLVGTSGYGLFEIRLDQEKHPYGLRMIDFEPSNFIMQLFEDKGQNLWISTEKNGLYKYEKNKSKKYFGNKESQKKVVISLAEGKDGTLLAGKLNGGLYRYDRLTDNFKPIGTTNMASSSILDIYIGSDNRILIGTSGQGIKIYHPTSNQLTDLYSNPTTVNLTTSKASSIMEDEAGNIWMGIPQKGVFLLPKNRNRFGYIGHRSSKRDLIGDYPVMSLLEDRTGSLWVGTDGDGLYQLSNTHLKSKKFVTHGTVQPPSSIMAIFEDAENNLWLGGAKEGLIKVNRTTGLSTPIRGLTDKHGDDVELIHSICEDKSKRLWIGSMGAGLFCLDKQTGKTKNFVSIRPKNHVSEQNHLPNNWINCLLTTAADKLYIGTYDGLACLDLKTESFVNTHGHPKLFAGCVVYTLFDDQCGNLWAGTSKGLLGLHMATGKTTRYTIELGLPSNTVYAIQADAEKNLWLSTNRGLAKFYPQEQRFVSFFADDGLQGNEFVMGASFLSTSGELYFGGLNGISHFNPLEIQIQPHELSAKIIDFYIHDKAINKHMKSGKYQIIDTTVTSAKRFHLAHNDNSFTVEFSTMDFSQAERVDFMYRINGDDWVHLGTGINRVTFNHLETGQHILTYRAKVNEIYSDSRQVQIIIHPVWYLSPTAKVLYVLFASCCIFWIGKTLRSRHLLKQQMLAHYHAEQLNEAKVQFFIQIAHEIRTPLTLLINPLKKLLDQSHLPDKERLYAVIDRNVQRLLDLVNQLMDIRKIEKGLMKLDFQRIEMVAFIKMVASLFDEQCAAKQVKLFIRSESEKIYARIDPRNFDKVLINVLANACKYTPEDGTIHLFLGIKNSSSGLKKPTFTIAIADSGQSLNLSESERIFDCFYQAENQINRQGYGTGIGLHLSRQLVELHEGSIRVENTPPYGYSFVIEMPLDADQQTLVDDSYDLVPDSFKSPTLSASILGTKSVSTTKKRIAIVDDDDDIREYLKNEFITEYAIDTYANGFEAYKGILNKLPDLIISDVMMPHTDGLELCQKLRNNVLVNDLPIVLLTAKSDDAHQLQGLGAGADLYIMKPFKMEVLTESIRTLIINRDMVRMNERKKQRQEAYISKVDLKSADEKLLEKVYKMIEKHMANPHLSVEMIANEVGISRVHLHRKLKELTRLTTKDLIRNIRIEQAANLLASKRLTISEVAYAVGYNDVNNFTIAFKLVYEQTPKAFATEKTA